jgi:hypothetical protein
MRKALLVSAVLLLGTALMFAQDTNSSSSSSQNGTNASSQSGSSGSEGQAGTTTTTQQTTSTRTEQTTGKNSVQGCLTGSSGNYTLTNAMGMTYQLQGDDSELSANVNKEVEVIGTPSATASASASNSPTTDSSAGSATTPETSTGSAGSSAHASSTKTMQVTSVQKIADTCSSGNQGAPQR